MIHMMRKLKCKFTGSDDFLPEGIPREKFMPVLGYEVRRRDQVKNDKKIVVEDIYYIVTTDKGKVIPIASFNCATMIDERAEIDLAAAVELLKNVTMIGKILSEKMAKMDTTPNGNQDKRKD